VISCTAAGAQPQLSDQAAKALAEGNWDQAKQIYAHIYRTEPTNSKANAFLARLALSAGNVDEATKMLETAVKSDPQNASAHSLLADIYARGNQYERAIEHYRAVMELKPTVTARLNVVASLEAAGKLEEAIKLLRMGLIANKTNCRLQLELGRLYLKTDRLPEAIGCFKNARDVNSSDSEPFEMLAIASGARNDWQSAFDYAKTFCDLAPGNVNAMMLAAWSAYASGDVLEGKNRLEEAVDIAPDNAALRNLLAITLVDLKRYDAAKEQLDEALRLDPQNLEVRMNQTMLALISGKYADGVANAETLERENPEMPAVLSLSAYAKLLAGDKDGARATATKAIESQGKGTSSGDTLAQIVLARLYRLDEKFDQATVLLKAALGTAGGASFVHCEMANCLLEQGNFSKAAEEAQFALQLSSANLDAKKVLARALAKQGNWDGALLYLREMAARSPKDLAARMELAHALTNKGDFESATLACEAARKISPKSKEPLRLLLQIAGKQGDKKTARKLEAELSALAP
jgi:tetratricopeptide (TPR) repeat protein